MMAAATDMISFSRVRVIDIGGDDDEVHTTRRWIFHMYAVYVHANILLYIILVQENVHDRVSNCYYYSSNRIYIV